MLSGYHTVLVFPQYFNVWVNINGKYSFNEISVEIPEISDLPKMMDTLYYFTDDIKSNDEVGANRSIHIGIQSVFLRQRKSL